MQCKERDLFSQPTIINARSPRCKFAAIFSGPFRALVVARITITIGFVSLLRG